MRKSRLTREKAVNDPINYTGVLFGTLIVMLMICQSASAGGYNCYHYLTGEPVPCEDEQPSGGQQPNIPPNPDRMHENEANNAANALYKAKNYADAIAKYNEALRYCHAGCDYLHKNIAYARRDMEGDRGSRFFKQQDYDAAIAAYTSALKHCRPDMDCSYLRKNIVAARHNIDVVRRNRQIENRNREKSRGDHLMDQGDYDGAIAAFREAWNFCDSHMDCDYIKKSIAYAERNREADRGSRLFKQRDWNAAIAAYEEALSSCRADMDCGYLHKNIATARKNQKNDRHRRENSRLEQEAKELAGAGEADRAEELLRELVASNPKSAYYANSLGGNLFQQERFEEAEAVFRQGIALNPDDAPLHYNLALALKRQGRQQEAEQEVRAALSLDPAFKEAQQLLTKWQAGQLEQAEEFDLAESTLRGELAKHPDNSDAANRLGNLLIDQFRDSEAEVLYRNGLEHDPENAVLHYNLSLLMKREGRYEEAEQEAQRAVKLDPSYERAKELLNNIQQTGVVRRHLDPFINPVMRPIARSVYVIGSKRRELAKSLLDDYNNIREQASSAQFHGHMAEGSKGESAKEESSRVFDTQGQNIGNVIDPLVVDGRQSEETEALPEGLLRHPEWQKLEALERSLQQDVAQKEKEIASLEQMRSSPEVSGLKKAMVLVAIAKVKEELFFAEHEVKVTHQEKEQLRISFSLGELTETKEALPRSGEGEEQAPPERDEDQGAAGAG